MAALAYDGGHVVNAALEPLELLVDEYLWVRRALGYSLQSSESTLRRFLAYLHGQGAETITVADAVAFATAPPQRSARTQALRLSAIRCFARWARCRRPEIEVPPARVLPARPTRVAPFIYTDDQILALLEAARTLRPAQHAVTFGILIGLMAATGVRTGEALALDTTSYSPRTGTL